MVYHLQYKRSIFHYLNGLSFAGILGTFFLGGGGGGKCDDRQVTTFGMENSISNDDAKHP